jgi:transglutaminase-like putative cysteine protease
MESRKNIALVLIFTAFIAFMYVTAKALEIASSTQVGTKNGIYTSYVTSSDAIVKRAKTLSQGCQDKLCQVQTLLDSVTNIPYHSTTFQKNSAQETIQNNFGDCDDKSNLLVSMLHAVEIEAYFVLVPSHIFVVVPLNDSVLKHKKGLWINGKKYYILETTAKNSHVGYPLRYPLSAIDTIIEPFSNQKVEVKQLEYKL